MIVHIVSLYFTIGKYFVVKLGDYCTADKDCSTGIANSYCPTFDAERKFVGSSGSYVLSTGVYKQAFNCPVCVCSVGYASDFSLSSPKYNFCYKGNI